MALANCSWTIIFEGAQGVLLDEKFGYTPPHVTWTDCTFNNVYNELLGCISPGDVWWERWGVTRTYLTRHGAGPLPDEWATPRIGDPHNSKGEWQGEFREAPLNLPLLRYSSEALKGIDFVSLTHLDKIPASHRPIELATRAKIGLTSHGPTFKDKIYHGEES